MIKLNENICDQITRAAVLLREAAGGYRTTHGRGASGKRPSFDELIEVAASLEAIVKREKRFSMASTGK